MFIRDLILYVRFVYVLRVREIFVMLILLRLALVRFPTMMIALSRQNKRRIHWWHHKKPRAKEKILSATCNDIITLWILNSVSKEIAVSIVYSRFAKSIWDELKNRFKQSNDPHVYQLRKELVTTNKGVLSVEAY